MAFGGDPSAKNYESFEMIQYREATHSFEFSKIVFSPTAPPLMIQSPPECVRCHDHPGHPNWTPYPFWPGAFPSEDGFDQSGDKEQGLYQTFYNNQAKQGRYQFLHLKTAEQLVPNDHPPTKRLSNILQDLAERSVPQQILSSRNYTSYRYLIRAALEECENLDSYVPEGLRSRFAHTYEEVLAQTTQEEKKSYEDRVRSSYQLTGKDYEISGDDDINFSLRDIPATAGLRYVMERDGGSIAPWFYSFDTKQWTVMRSSMTSVGYSELFDEDGAYGQSCSELKASSLRALQTLPAGQDALSTGLLDTEIVGDRNGDAISLTDSQLLSAQSLIQNSCLKCHRTGADAPRIDFADIGKLASELRQRPVGKTSTQLDLYRELMDRLRASDERRMPPDHELSEPQVLALIQYFDEVSETTGATAIP
jgi:hypothetical protein